MKNDAHAPVRFAVNVRQSTTQEKVYRSMCVIFFLRPDKYRICKGNNIYGFFPENFIFFDAQKYI